MSRLAVDAEGKRIKTDILVSSYIRENGKKCELLIPDDINKICFEFWLIKICDEWDKKYIYSGVTIDGDIAKYSNDSTIASVYGCHSIDKGSYSWEMVLRRPSHPGWFCVGLIEDTPDILQNYTGSCTYYIDGHGCHLFHNGCFYDPTKKQVTESFVGHEETKIVMVVNMNEHKLWFNINDTEDEIATDQLDTNKSYRMVINFNELGNEVELL